MRPLNRIALPALLLIGLLFPLAGLRGQGIVVEGAGYAEKVAVDRARTVMRLFRVLGEQMRHSVAVYGYDRSARRRGLRAERLSSDSRTPRRKLDPANPSQRLWASTDDSTNPSRRFRSRPLLGYGMRGDARSTSRYGVTGSVRNEIHHGLTGSARNGIRYGVTGSARNGIDYGVSGPVRIGIRYGVTGGTRGSFRYGFQVHP